MLGSTRRVESMTDRSKANLISLIPAARLAGLVTLVIVFLPASLSAQPKDVEVITPNRIREPLRKTPQSITVITREEMLQQHAVTLEEVLRNVPGLQFQGTGTIGEETNVRIRGSEFDQVLILMDGVEINSPFTQEVDLGDILVDNLDKVEIVRGPQSASYGSEALGGVIHIITRKGEGEPTVRLFGMGGNFATAYEGAEASGSAGGLDLSLSASRLDSAGQFDRDRFFVNAFTARIGYSYDDVLELELVGRYRGSEDEVAVGAALDFANVNPIIIVFDPNRDYKSRASSNVMRLRHNVAPWWSYSLQGAFYSINTDDTDVANAGSPYTTLSDFIDADANRLAGSMQHDLSLPYVKNVSLGLEIEREQLDFFEYGNTESFGLGPPTTTVLHEARDNLALWWQWVYSWAETVVLSGGVRYDDNADFGEAWTPRASMAVVVPVVKTRLKGNFGQGFRAPSFTELNLPGFGNTELDAEKNIGYDVGFEQSLFDERVVFEGLYYFSEYRGLIEQDPITFRWSNLEEATAQGAEAGIRIKPVFSLGEWQACKDNCLLIVNYTYLTTRDKETGEELSRRPNNAWNASLVYALDDVFEIRFDANVRSSHKEDLVLTDTGGRLRTGRTQGFVVIDAAATYHLVRNASWARDLRLVGKVSNLLDEDYEEFVGFPMPGINFLAGIEWLY